MSFIAVIALNIYMNNPGGNWIGVYYNEKTDIVHRLKNCLSFHINATIFTTCAAANFSIVPVFSVVSLWQMISSMRNSNIINLTVFEGP